MGEWLSKQLLVVILSLIASVTTVLAFFTGKSFPEFFSVFQIKNNTQKPGLWLYRSKRKRVAKAEQTQLMLMVSLLSISIIMCVAVIFLAFVGES